MQKGTLVMRSSVRSRAVAMIVVAVGKAMARLLLRYRNLQNGPLLSKSMSDALSLVVSF